MLVDTVAPDNPAKRPRVATREGYARRARQRGDAAETWRKAARAWRRRSGTGRGRDARTAPAGAAAGGVTGL
ncbi:hypothetical protein GCM10010400_09760 [Streptomyces aculeolatus]